MTKPQWYAAEIAKLGQLVLDGAKPRADAIGALGAEIGAHPEYLADLVAADASRELAKWLSDHRQEPPQLGMFPELKRSYRTTPSRYVEVAAMTAHDVDMARAILWAKTQNAIDGARDAAEHERAVFAEFEAKVRPLLAGGLTVADVLGDLGDEAAL
jgi:hypothetical protein